MFKQILSLLGGALGIALFVAVAWFYLFHVEVTATTVRIVYERGDLLHRLLSLIS